MALLFCLLTEQNATAQAWRSVKEGEYMYTEHRYFESRDELLEFLKSFDSVPDEQKPKVYLVDDDTGEMTRVM